MIASARARIEAAVVIAESQPVLAIDDYLAFGMSVTRSCGWRPLTVPETDRRLVTILNETWSALMAENPEVVMIGEDILSPYGGAFKVTKDLSDQYPGRVISTPISEAAITGLANGLALAGMKPVVEIMFGDFITLGQEAAVFGQYRRRHRCAAGGHRPRCSLSHCRTSGAQWLRQQPLQIHPLRVWWTVVVV